MKLVAIDFEFDDMDTMEELAQKNPAGLLLAMSNAFRGANINNDDSLKYVADRLFDMAQTLLTDDMEENQKPEHDQEASQSQTETQARA